MKSITSLAVVVMVGLSLSAGRALADDKEAVGNGAKAWVTAMMDGDVKGLKAHSVGDEKEMARWEAMTKMLSGFKKMSEAATAKYGEQADAMSRMFRKPDFTQMQAGAKIDVQGDDATITGKDSKVMKLKKDGGEWKVVLSSMQDSGKMDPKQAEAMGDAAAATGEEIKDGKYPTYLDAMKAFQLKMVAAMGAQGGRPGRPGATPAK